MKLNRKSQEETYTARFNESDLAALNAAYRERLARMALQDEISEVQDIDLKLSELGPKVVSIDVNASDITGIVEELTIFANNTSEQVIELARRTGMPDYLNSNIPQRIKLGRAAIALAQDFTLQELNSAFTFEPKGTAIIRRQNTA